MRRGVRAWRLGLALALALGAASAGGLVVSSAEAAGCPGERERARRLAARLQEQWPLRSNDAVTALVEQVGRRVAQASPRLPYPWRFTVVRHRGANAFSIGEGRIYVHDGTVRLAQSESELAAVIAHEMAHQLRGHFCPTTGGETSTRGPQERQQVGEVYQRINPAREIEADETALEMLWIAGYDPHAALRMARRVRHQKNGSPGHYLVDRIQVLQSLLAGVPSREVVDSPEFRRVKQELASEPGR
jgi:predicted Zn-dependent protease